MIISINSEIVIIRHINNHIPDICISKSKMPRIICYANWRFPLCLQHFASEYTTTYSDHIFLIVFFCNIKGITPFKSGSYFDNIIIVHDKMILLNYLSCIYMLGYLIQCYITNISAVRNNAQ